MQMFKLTGNKAPTNKRERELLENWIQHFDERAKIPAGLVRVGEYYSVWRIGERATVYEAKTKTEKPRGVLLKAVHGFDAIWREEGGVVDPQCEIRDA